MLSSSVASAEGEERGGNGVVTKDVEDVDEDVDVDVTKTWTWTWTWTWTGTRME